MKRRTFSSYPVLAVLVCGLISCSRCSLPGQTGVEGEITVLSYNCQNIFDDVDGGDEYPEFDPSSGGWDSRLFHARLSNLSEVIRASCEEGPDIIALQEIENLNVLETLADQYLKGMGYRYRICVPEAGSAVQTGVISRLPVETYRAHRLETAGGAPMRNILEVSLETDGGSLVLLNNHWKSKLGGAEETETLRLRSASLLCRRIRELGRERPEACIIILGDLNENHDEYLLAGERYQTALLPEEVTVYSGNRYESIYLTSESSRLAVTEERVVLFCPWGEIEGGSYMYHSVWEHIDHALLTRGFFDGVGIEYLSFAVMKEPFLLSEGIYPRSWNTSTEKGYSDHLPLIIRLSTRRDGDTEP